MSSEREKAGEREMEKLGLEERHAREREQARKFAKLHGMGPREAKEHLAEVEREHKRQKDAIERGG